MTGRGPVRRCDNPHLRAGSRDVAVRLSCEQLRRRSADVGDDKREPDRSVEATSTSTSAPTAPGRPRRREAAATVKRTTSTLRSKLASLLWLVAVVCALFLAV